MSKRVFFKLLKQLVSFELQNRTISFSLGKSWLHMISVCMTLLKLALLFIAQVANKLYVLNYISEDIERFAENMLLSAVDQRGSDIELSQCEPSEQRTVGEVCSICFLHLCSFTLFYSFHILKLKEIWHNWYENFVTVALLVLKGIFCWGFVSFIIGLGCIMFHWEDICGYSE